MFDNTIKNIFWFAGKEKLVAKLVGVFLLVNSFGTVYTQEVFVQYGNASVYSDKFEGRFTANGEKYVPQDFTAAHLSLAFNSKVRVINLETNQSVIVRINDRGPFVQGRIIDLSRAAAEKIGMLKDGVVRVRIEMVKDEESKDEPVFKTPAASQPAPEPAKIAKTDKPARTYYQLEASAASPSGFGVQVGSFQELANFVRMSQSVRALTNEKIMVEVTEINQVTIHRVIIGNFPERKLAETLKAKLQSAFPDCFIYIY